LFQEEKISLTDIKKCANLNQLHISEHNNLYIFFMITNHLFKSKFYNVEVKPSGIEVGLLEQEPLATTNKDLLKSIKEARIPYAELIYNNPTLIEIVQTVEGSSILRQFIEQAYQDAFSVGYRGGLITEKPFTNSMIATPEMQKELKDLIAIVIKDGNQAGQNLK
jgi:hypothetical protein